MRPPPIYNNYNYVKKEGKKKKKKKKKRKEKRDDMYIVVGQNVNMYSIYGAGTTCTTSILLHTVSGGVTRLPVSTGWNVEFLQ